MQQVRWIFPLLVIGLALLWRFVTLEGDIPSPPCAPEVEFLGAQASAAILVCASDLPKECAEAKRGDRAVLSDGGCQVLAEQMSAANRLILGLPLDLNRAEVEDLVLLRGIGETTARSIVRFRETQGSFTTVDELSKVEGIGEGRLQRLRTHFMVSNSVENRLKVLDSSTDGD